MRQTPKLGPLALLLTVISICLTIMSVLSMTTASADMRLAQKYADTVKERYALEIKGQELIAELNASSDRGTIPDEFTISDDQNGMMNADLKEGELTLRIGVKAKDGGYEIVSWKYEHDWEQDLTIGNLWPGND